MERCVIKEFETLVCRLCSYKKKLLQGRRVGKLCNSQLRCMSEAVSTSLFTDVSPFWSGLFSQRKHCVESYGSVQRIHTRMDIVCKDGFVILSGCSDAEKSETSVSMDSDIMLGDPEQTSRCKQLLDLVRVKRSKVPFAERWDKPGRCLSWKHDNQRSEHRSLSHFLP